jgi:hypothetical protein
VFDDGVKHFGEDEVMKPGGFGGALHPSIKYQHLKG